MSEELLQARRSLGHVLNDSINLEPQDYELIGEFVQAYCVADLEARRGINALSHVHTGVPTDYALKLNDKDAIDHLERRAKEWEGQMEVKEGLLMVVDILRGHRHLRHVFAHWAGRRVPKYDALIFFSANLGGHKIPEGAIKYESVEGANMQYGLVPLKSVRDELEKLQGHTLYLINIGRQLEENADRIAQDFARSRGLKARS